MANRYEKVAAYSTLRGLHQAVESAWLVSHWLTEYEPRTGQPLKVPLCGTGLPDVSPDGPQLKEYCDLGMVPVNNNLTQLQGVLANAGFRSYLSVGLTDWNETLTRVDIDTDRLNTVSIQYASNINENKEDMDSLGRVIQGVNFDLDTLLTPLPDDVRILTIIHDLLEACSYNLRCINDANGTMWADNSVDNIKKYVFQRMRSLNTLRPSAYAKANITEVDKIYTIADYVQAEYQSINNRKQGGDLADYIEANIPRLPLLRRYWSL